MIDAAVHCSATASETSLYVCAPLRLSDCLRDLVSVACEDRQTVSQSHAALGDTLSSFVGLMTLLDMTWNARDVGGNSDGRAFFLIHSNRHVLVPAIAWLLY